MQTHNRYVPWTEIEDARLAELFGDGKTHAEIGKIVGLSTSAVGHRCVELGLRRRGLCRHRSRRGAPEIEALEIMPLSQQPLHVRLWVRERTRPMPPGLPVVPPAIIDNWGRRLG